MQRKSKNHHPCRFFHLTYKGHHEFPFPTDTAPVKAFYCFEYATPKPGETGLGQPHTHVAIDYGVQTITWKNMVTAVKILLRREHEDNKTPLELRDQEPEVAIHPNWNTIYGYHHGFGNKTACPAESIKWIEGEEHISVHCRRLLKKPVSKQSPAETKQINFLFLNTNLSTLVDEGHIHLNQLKKLQDAKDIYNRIRQNHHEDVPSWPYGINEKRRHIWVCDKPSSGKTAMSRDLHTLYGAYFKNLSEPLYWQQYTGQQIIVLNDFAGSIPVSIIKSLTDGLGTVAVKGGHVAIHRAPIFVVTSNHKPHELWSKHFEVNPIDQVAIETRFNIIDARTMYNQLHCNAKLIPHFPTGEECQCSPRALPASPRTPYDHLIDIDFFK